MQLRMRDLRRKEIINIQDGGRLGFVADVDFLVPEGQVLAITVNGPAKFFGLFGRREEYYIPWDCIQRIGEDIILIEKSMPELNAPSERKRRGKL